MKIGSVELAAGAGLAPMAGVTDMPFRSICHNLKSGWAVSEMLSAKGYLHAPNEPRAVQELLRLSPNEGIVGLQLFGHEPDTVAQAASLLSDRGYRFIDINMGCPAHKIVSGGDGSALMKKPDLCGRIVEAVVKKTALPVTVKIRSGWDEWHQNAVEIARIVQSAGASAITVHARTREQFYLGKADWGVIGRVVNAVSIPVIGNGDVVSGRSAIDMLNETGCSAVMVGRAAQGNPWIFSEIHAALSSLPFTPPTFTERAQMALYHLNEEAKMRSERGAVLEMRKHIAWYLSGAPGAASIRARINAMENIDDVRDALTALIQTPE